MFCFILSCKAIAPHQDLSYLLPGWASVGMVETANLACLYTTVEV